MQIEFFSTIATLQSDIGFAFKSLRRRPLVTGLSILSLGLGMALATHVFGMIEPLVTSPPFPDSKLVLRVFEFEPKHSQELPGVFARHLQALQDTAGPWASVAGAKAAPPLNLGTSGVATSASCLLVTPNFIETLGVRLAFGRSFGEGAGEPGAPSVAIVSYAVWRDRLGAPKDVANTFITLNGRRVQVTGVLPSGFAYPFDADVWLPLGRDQIRHSAQLVEADWPRFLLVGRAKTINLRQLTTWTQVIVKRADADAGVRDTPRIRLSSVADASIRDGIAESSVWIAIAVLVLFLCATNFATGFLGSAMRRRRELAIRSAVGASTRRLSQLFLCEAVLLGLGGGVLATFLSLLLADWGVGVSQLPLNVSRSVIVFGIIGTIAMGTVFGLAPTLQLCRGDLRQYMTDDTTPTKARLARDRGALVGLQICLAVICVSSVGALVYADVRFDNFGPGYEYESVLTATVVPSDPAGPHVSERQLLDFVRAIPVVQAAAVTHSPQGERGAIAMSSEQNVNRIAGVPWIDASDDFFAVLGVTPIDGRLPTVDEINSRAPVAVLAAGAALNLGAHPVGMRIRLKAQGGRPVWLMVIGIVPDVRRGPDFSIFDTPVFTSLSLPEDSTPTRLLIRARGNAGASLSSLKKALARINVPIVISDLKTIASQVDTFDARARRRRAFLAVISIVALVLSSIGVYSLSSYVAAARAREMYIRLALGASRASVIVLVMRALLGMALIGSVVGILVASRFADILNIVLWGPRGSPAPLARFPIAPAIGAAALLLMVSLMGALVPMAKVTRPSLIDGLRR